MSLSAAASDDDDDGGNEEALVPSAAAHHKSSKKHHPHRERPPVPVSDEADGEDSPAPRRRRAPETDSGGEGGNKKYVGKYDQYWEDDEYDKKAKAVSTSPKGISPDSGTGNGNSESDNGDLNGLPFDPLQMCKDAWSGFCQLPIMERIYCCASIGLIFFAMLPWYSYRNMDGFEDTSHMMVEGICFLLGVFSIVNLVLKRKSKMIPGVPPKLVPLIPVICGFVSALISIFSCLYILQEKSVSMTFAPCGSLGCAVILFLGSGGAGLFNRKKSG